MQVNDCKLWIHSKCCEIDKRNTATTAKIHGTYGYLLVELDFANDIILIEEDAEKLQIM